MSQIAVATLLIFVIFVLFYLAEKVAGLFNTSSDNEYGHKSKKGKMKAVVSCIIKYFLWLAALWLCVGALGICVEIVEDNAYPFLNTINVIFKVFMTIVILASTAGFIGGMFYFVKWLGEKVNEQGR